jgi:hypothetical protein
MLDEHTNYPTHSFDITKAKNGKYSGECLLTGHSPFWFDVYPKKLVKCWHCNMTVHPPWHLYELYEK